MSDVCWIMLICSPLSICNDARFTSLFFFTIELQF